jgi:integrase
MTGSMNCFTSSPTAGCRGELAGLEWRDLDLDGAALAVRRQWVQLGWEVIEERGATR